MALKSTEDVCNLQVTHHQVQDVLSFDETQDLGDVVERFTDVFHDGNDEDLLHTSAAVLSLLCLR